MIKPVLIFRKLTVCLLIAALFFMSACKKENISNLLIRKIHPFLVNGIHQSKIAKKDVI